jgi:hypothetical protein
MQVIKRLTVATALIISSLFLNNQGASAALHCPIGSPNMNNGEVCAEADYVTNQGFIQINGAAILNGNFWKLEMQSKIGTTAWATRCTVYSKAPTVCSGISGFATTTNTQVRAKLYYAYGRYAYFSVPVGQV